MKPTILIVEDNEPYGILLQSVLSEIAEVRLESRLDSAKRALEDKRIEVIILDLGLPDSSGVDTLQCLRSHDIPIIVLTGDSTITPKQVAENGGRDLLLKTETDIHLIRDSVIKAIGRGRLKRKVAEGVKNVRLAADKFLATI